MTGAYLFKKINGKRTPTEVEYLTDEERHEIFKHRDVEEVINWLNLTCNTIAMLAPPTTDTKNTKDV